MFSLGAGSLFRCRMCDTAFYSPRPTACELSDFYASQTYRDDYKSGDMVGEEFAGNRYCQFAQALRQYDEDIFNENSRRLLDIGCGTGDFLKIARQNDWQVAGVEVSQDAVLEANKKLERDCVSLELADQLQGNRNAYSVITSYHVIEHLLAPLAMLKQAHELLKPGGIIFIETPNIGGLGARLLGERWSQLKPVEHINYFNRRSLFFALREAGFVDITTMTIRPQKIQSVANFPQIVQGIMLAAYEIVPKLNLGASLQGIATKPR